MAHLDVVIDFVALFFFALYDRYFLIEHPINQGIVSGDERDFTYIKNRTTLRRNLKFFIFCYFYKIGLAVFLIIGAIDNLSGSNDLISGFILFFFS